MVEGRKLRLIQSLYYGQYGGIDEPEIGIGVLVAQFAGTPIVCRGQIFHCEVPFDYLIKEGDKGIGVHAFPQPVIDLGEHWGWDDEHLVCIFEHSTATRVIGVAIIKSGEEWAGVED